MKIVLLISFFLSILQCEAFADEKLNENLEQKYSIRIGTLPAADSLLLHVAKDEGIFDQYGLDVQIVPFQSALELGVAMRANALDGHFGDIINVLIQNETGVPQKIIATTSYAVPTQRHFALVLSPHLKIKNLEELKGKQIAIGKDTIVDYLLTRLMTARGMTDDFVVRQDVRAIPMRLQLLMAGHLDAALLPEPLASTLEARGASIVLDDTILSEPLAVIALRDDVINKKGLVSRFRKALYESAKKINNKDESGKYLDIMVEKGLLSANAKEAYTLLTFDLDKTPLSVPSQKALDSYIEWMQARNILKKIPQYDDVIWLE